jgi:hypothetical protein
MKRYFWRMWGASGGAGILHTASELAKLPARQNAIRRLQNMLRQRAQPYMNLADSSKAADRRR